MNAKYQTAIEGVFSNVIYSPHGGIEGVLIQSEGQPMQIVFDHHDEESPAAFDGVESGQAVVLEAIPAGPSPKGEGEHPVYAFGKLVSVDGKKPAIRLQDEMGPAYRGNVVRLNHARHGAPNGVVLDTGDFIHMRPEGMAKLRLKVGDKVAADGDAHRLADDSGWAVEATTVNGKPVKPH